jgi:DnaJ-class molecular chaperone
MQKETDHYNFYRALGVQPQANDQEIIQAHQSAIASLQPDSLSGEERKRAALELLAANTARHVLTDSEKRKVYDVRLNDLLKVESEREKIQAKRAGKLQEQQSIEDDEKLKQISLRAEAALESLADFYYEELFAVAREGNIPSVSLDKLLEWISGERAEFMRQSEQKGRRVSFRIDLHGLSNVQEMRKKRTEEIGTIVEGLVKQFMKSK